MHDQALQRPAGDAVLEAIDDGQVMHAKRVRAPQPGDSRLYDRKPPRRIGVADDRDFILQREARPFPHAAPEQGRHGLTTIQSPPFAAVHRIGGLVYWPVAQFLV